MGMINNVELPTQEEVEARKKAYVGKRIELVSMPDPSPIESGALGTCYDVDGMGQLQMKWDNGRTLSLIPNVDSFKVID